MKELKLQGQTPSGIWHIGGKGTTNPFCGRTLRVTWKKTWGGKPAGTQITGELAATFCVNGRTLIGELLVPARNGGRHKVSAPWSRNWIDVEILS